MSLKLWLGLSSLGVMGVVPLAYNFVNSSSETVSGVQEESGRQAGQSEKKTSVYHECPKVWEDFLL